MSVMPTGTGKTAVGGFIYNEQVLLDVLRVVPYCDTHAGVWSPILATLLLDTCSLLDSLWKVEARAAGNTKERLDIRDYFEQHHPIIAPRWLVFWADEPAVLEPFQEWKSGSYSPPDWWTGYNDVKHDRIANRTQATLKRTITALAALFLAIVKCDDCADELAQAGWLSGIEYDLLGWLRKDALLTPSQLEVTGESIAGQFITAESKLFTYAVGWSGVQTVRGSNWDDPRASHRWRQWYYSYER